MVTCRQAGRGHAAAAVATDVFNRGRESGPGVDTRPVMAGVTCRGDEASLMECDHDEDVWCPGTGMEDVAAVMCTDTQAGLLFLPPETINARPASGGRIYVAKTVSAGRFKLIWQKLNNPELG